MLVWPSFLDQKITDASVKARTFGKMNYFIFNYENGLTLEDGRERRRGLFQGEPLPFENPLEIPVDV